MRKEQIFYQGHQHTFKIIGCINSLKIHFRSRIITIKNSNLTFVCHIFLWKKRKKKNWNLEPLFWICQIIFPIVVSTIFVQMSFIQIWPFIYWYPPLHLHHIEEFILIILDNITLCSSQPNKDKEGIIRLHKNKISIVKIFKQGVVHAGVDLKFLGPQ